MPRGLWHCLTVADAEPMMRWLEAIGFDERAVYRDERDPGTVVHAQYDWPRGGGVMFSTYADRPDWPVRPGTAAAYLVCDDLHSRATAAGATTLRPPEDQDYGGRAATVRHPEGNLWSIGTYAGE